MRRWALAFCRQRRIQLMEATATGRPCGQLWLPASESGGMANVVHSLIFGLVLGCQMEMSTQIAHACYGNGLRSNRQCLQVWGNTQRKISLRLAHEEKNLSWFALSVADIHAPPSEMSRHSVLGPAFHIAARASTMWLASAACHTCSAVRAMARG